MTRCSYGRRGVVQARKGSSEGRKSSGKIACPPKIDIEPGSRHSRPVSYWIELFFPLVALFLQSGLTIVLQAICGKPLAIDEDGSQALNKGVEGLMVHPSPGASRGFYA